MEETPEEEAERQREEELYEQRQARREAARARGEAIPEEDDEEEEEEEAILFLPTGLSRPKPQRFYKGSDPEWQEFVRIAPDRQRMERVRGELVALIHEMAVRQPQFALRLGKISPTAGASWIEFKFPDGPPIEFERPGIELTEDGTIRRSTRPVNELAHHRLTNTLMPTAVAKSLYLDTKRKIGRTWSEFKTYMGYEDKSKPNFQSMIIQFPPPQLGTTSQQPTPTSPSTTEPTSSPTPSIPDNAPQSPTSSSPPSEKEPASPSPDDPVYERFGLVLPKPTALTLDLSTFRQSFHKEQRQIIRKLQPPRGTFLVSGLVEIIGERAKMTLDVIGAYDPKKGRYVMVKAQVRSVTQYRQDPKGGP